VLLGPVGIEKRAVAVYYIAKAFYLVLPSVAGYWLAGKPAFRWALHVRGPTTSMNQFLHNELSRSSHDGSQKVHWEKIMRKSIVAAVLITGALMGNAFAQPATNGPSGSGPEGSPSAAVKGSAENPEAKTSTGKNMKMTKHTKKKRHSM
jgi:hypothetical protein